MSKITNTGGGGNVTQKTIHPKGGPAGLGGKSGGYEEDRQDDYHGKSGGKMHYKPKSLKSKKRIKESGSKSTPSSSSSKGVSNISKGVSNIKNAINQIASKNPVKKPVVPAKKPVQQVAKKPAVKKKP